MMVALDDEGKPVEVPRLILENASEQSEWEAAEKRREMRSQRKMEGY